MTYGPTANGFSPPTGTNPFEFRYSIATRSDQDSPIAPAWNPESPAFGPPTIRFVIACVYSCPITLMSKSPSTQGA